MFCFFAKSVDQNNHNLGMTFKYCRYKIHINENFSQLLVDMLLPIMVPNTISSLVKQQIRVEILAFENW